MDKITAAQAAKRLNILTSDLAILEKQGIVHSIPESNLYSSSEIDQIKSRRGPTLSEEATLVDVQIQQEVVGTVSSLQKLKKKISIFILLAASLFSGIAILIAILFNIFPVETSDFFGYYYKFNKKSAQEISSAVDENSDVLAATTDLTEVPLKTTILADVLKPVVATSLILVKATDSEKYAQIVTNPTLGMGLPGPAGIQGIPGSTGSIGEIGPQGLRGSAGINGTNGINGTSVADVLSGVGDLIIRDKNNSTTRLPAGTNNQVLTISDSVPVWANLTNVNLSGNAGITNANLAHSTLTITPGNGLTGGGLVTLGETTTLNLNLSLVGTTGLTASNSGLEKSSSGLSLLHGCGDGQLLKWTDARGWACADDLTSADPQQVASYDSSSDLTRVTSEEITLTTISVTHLEKTADVYVTGQAEVFSASAADQPFTLAIETGEKCDGPAVGNARVIYTITSGPSSNNLRGVLVVSGVDLNIGQESQSYSLCASTSAGTTDVQNWRLEALVLE